MKVFLTTLALAFTFNTVTFAESPKKLDTAMYVGSGVLGTLVGFGTGHILQDRYLKTGWIFTAGEGAGLVLMIAGAIVSFTGAYTAATTLNPRGAIGAWGAGSILWLTGGLIFGGFRIWDIVDIWGEPLWNKRLADASSGSNYHALSSVPSLSGAVAGLTFKF